MAPYLSPTVLSSHRFAVTEYHTSCPQLSFYRHVMEDSAHDKVQWLHCDDNKGNCASPMTLIVFMSKPKEAEFTHISLLSGPLENSEANLQESSAHCIGLYT